MTERGLVFAEGISEAAHGLDQTGLAALFELPAEAFHSNVDEVRLTSEAVAPHLLAELIARQNLAMVTEQYAQELELSGGEVQYAVSSVGLVRIRIEPEVAQA